MEPVVVNNKNKKTHVVCIPVPAQSHIKCMLKLARLLHHKGLDITFINTHSNQKRLFKSAVSQNLEDAPGFHFKTVPDGLSSTSDADTIPSQTWRQISNYLAANFFDYFLNLVSEFETPVTCIISDGLMNFAKTYDVAKKLNVPIILYWTLSASGFMGYYQAKVLVEKGLVPLKDESYLTNGYTDMVMDWIPGMEGIRLKDLPRHILATKPDDHGLNFCVEAARSADKVSHNIIHTFDELEATLVKELKSIFPQIITIGPIQSFLNRITTKETNNSNFNGYSLWKEEPECVQWLQSKEPISVMYVNFGSLAVMSLEDLIEFGWGLVNSDHYFLWIIRTDLVDGGSLTLPPELEEGIKRRGFIASWCSQEEVLSHPSIGGFLTHGGWGSVIESLSAGVPMLCWPISQDQRINCIQMCKEWEVGMEIGNKVNRHKVEKLVRDLMYGIHAKRFRMKAMEWKTKSEIATSPNGSSTLNIEELVHEITTMSRN